MMTTSVPTSTPRSTRSALSRLRAPSWLREPLLHFIVLGCVLFVIDHSIASRADDPRTIVVDAAVDNQAKEVFRASRGRDPNDDELYALRRVWLDNEVLYREGLALQVDKGDSAIRDRVIFKALSLIEANLKLPAYHDELLRGWFEAHRDKYDEPARYDFQEAVLVGDNSEANVRAFVASLNAGTPGDAKAGLRVFKGRPHANIVQVYGETFAKSLERSSNGEWLALATRDGWRAVRLETITPARPAAYEPLRGVVLQDWTDATMSEQRSAAVRALAKRYVVKVEEAAR